MGTFSGFIDFATQTASYINGSWVIGQLHQGQDILDSEPRYGYLNLEPQFGGALGYNFSSLSFNITNIYNTPKTLTFYSTITSLDTSLTGREHMGQKLGSITVPASGSHTVEITGDLFQAMKNEIEFGNWRFILYDNERISGDSDLEQVLTSTANYMQLGSMHVTAEAEPRVSGNGGGTFYTPYVNISGGKVDPYRRYRVEWTAQSGIVNWKLYCEGHEPLKPDYYVKIWNMKLGVEVGANTVIHEVSSTTVVVDKQHPKYASVANWSNKATTWTSGASSAELYKINALWGDAGQRWPLDGCLIAHGQFTLMGDTYDFAFTWSDIHYDSSYKPHTKTETFALDVIKSYTVTFDLRSMSLPSSAPIGTLPFASIRVFHGNSIVLPGLDTLTPNENAQGSLSSIYLCARPQDGGEIEEFPLIEGMSLGGWKTVITGGNDTAMPCDSLFTPTADITLYSANILGIINNKVSDLPTPRSNIIRTPLNISCVNNYEWANEQPKTISTILRVTEVFEGWCDETGHMLTEQDALNTYSDQTLYGQWKSGTIGAVNINDLPGFDDYLDIPVGEPIALSLDVNGGNPVETPIVKNIIVDHYFQGYSMVHNDKASLVPPGTRFLEDATVYAYYEDGAISNPTFKIPSTAKLGYSLEHWIDDNGNTYKPGATVGPLNSNLHLTAVWLRELVSKAVAYIFTNRF